MTNNPSNERSGRRPTGAIPGLSREDAPLLLPIQPSSTVDDITRLIREAGAQRIELLVPDGTTALQSIAGNETLREAAKAAGIKLTLYTADEKTTHAARFAKMDVVGIGGSVAAPQPGAQPRRPTGQQRAAPPAPRRPAAPPPPSAPKAQPARPTAPPPTDADLLQRLDAWEQAPPPAQNAASPMQQSSGGAAMYDVSGDVGVPRPADDDAEWNTFGQAAGRAPAADPMFDVVTQPTRRPRVIDDAAARPPRPSLLGALFGFLPQRGASRRAQRSAPPADEADGSRMSRPERSPEEAAARRRQSQSLTLWPLLGIGLLFVLGASLLVWSQRGSNSFQQTLNRVRGGTAPLNIAPPLNTTDVYTRPGLIVPLVTEPVSDLNSLNVQGVVISEPVTVTLQGSVEKAALTPIGFATGTVLLSNPTTGEITIPAGTPVSIGPQQFAFDSQVTVPGAVSDFSGTRNGQAEATVTARLPGAQSNVAADSAVTSDYTRPRGPIFARVAGAFTGGTDQEVPVVSPDDVSKLLPEALNRLYGQGVNTIQNRVQQLPGFALIKSETTSEISPTQELLAQSVGDAIQVFPGIGQVVPPELNNTFTLQIARRFEALASPLDRPIDDQLRQAVAAQLRRGGANVQPEEVQIASWRRGDAGLVVDAQVVPRSGYRRVSAATQQQMVANLRGKPRAEAEQYLAGLQEQGEIGAWQLPAEWTTIPDDLQLTFEPPAQPSTP